LRKDKIGGLSAGSRNEVGRWQKYLNKLLKVSQLKIKSKRYEPPYVNFTEDVLQKKKITEIMQGAGKVYELLTAISWK
jgi:hypothetical protein